MADYGLLGGIAEGLKSGIQTYTERKQQQFERNRQRGLLQEKGIDIDPETGETKMLPWAQAKHDMETQIYDPESDISIQGRAARAAAYEKTPSMAKQYQENNMSEAQMRELDKSVGQGLLKGEYGMLGRELTSDRFNRGYDLKEKGLDVRKDVITSHAADIIHNNPNIKTLTQQSQLMDRALNILNKPGLTNEEFNDVQIELSNAIAGARSAALGKLERTEYDTAQQSFARLKQKLTGKPQDAVPQEILDRVKGLALETKQSMDNHRYEYAKQLQRKYSAVPEANTEQQKAIESYKSETPPGLLEKVIVRKGNDVQKIPRGDLDAAKKDGYELVK